MTLSSFYLRAAVYILCLIASWYGMSAVQYEKILKANHTRQAQVLYVLLVLGLAYLAAQFILGFIYRI
ncbi:MAG: DUF1146 domain-containing protein [Solobacterium sp.]|nr:DUF1146 domain-containing protein [Solobacterium sp.]